MLNPWIWLANGICSSSADFSYFFLQCPTLTTFQTFCYTVKQHKMLTFNRVKQLWILIAFCTQNVNNQIKYVCMYVTHAYARFELNGFSLKLIWHKSCFQSNTMEKKNKHVIWQPWSQWFGKKLCTQSWALGLCHLQFENDLTWGSSSINHSLCQFICLSIKQSINNLKTSWNLYLYKIITKQWLVSLCSP